MSTTPDLAEYKKKIAEGYDFLFNNPTYWNAQFDRFARIASLLTGKPVAFNAAIFIIFIWVLSGPVFGFSDTWQLIINTATTIVTFLMVFLIQHTQNRDTEAVQVKLNELIRAMEGAHNALLDLEELEEEELRILHQRYTAMAKAAREKLRTGAKDTDTPEILHPEVLPKQTDRS